MGYYCIECGRPLTAPESIKTGIGFICAKKRNPETPETVIDSNPILPIPIREGIVMKREKGQVKTNIRRFITEHSPDGFEFGYGGSGPADLALNAVETLLRYVKHNGEKTKDGIYEDSYNLHQQFKWEFISKIPITGGCIPFDQAMEWIERQLGGSKC